jgi:DNA-binding NtrC family response regulator
VERAIILAEGEELTASDFQLGSGAASAKGLTSVDVVSIETKHQQQTPGDPFKSADGKVYNIGELEKRAILAALERNGGKREVSALELGITRRTLLNKLKEYGYEDSC